MILNKREVNKFELLINSSCEEFKNNNFPYLDLYKKLLNAKSKERMIIESFTNINFEKEIILEKIKFGVEFDFQGKHKFLEKNVYLEIKICGFKNIAKNKKILQKQIIERNKLLKHWNDSFVTYGLIICENNFIFLKQN